MSTPACGSGSAVRTRARSARSVCACAHARTHARFRPQRHARHALHARVHRAVRDRRPAGHVARRGGYRGVARGCRRRRCPSGRRRCGVAVRSSARTWPGSIDPTICRPSPAAKGPGAVVRPLGARSASPTGCAITTRKPDWLRPKVVHGHEVLALKKTVRDLGLVTVCEEAGCPNLSECWADGTATFMVLGERCTRACGFCLVDTHKPLAPDDDEPARVGRGRRRHGSGPRRAHDGGPR